MEKSYHVTIIKIPISLLELDDIHERLNDMDIVWKLIISNWLWNWIYLVLFEGLKEFHNVCGRSYID